MQVLEVLEPILQWIMKVAILGAVMLITEGKKKIIKINPKHIEG